MINCIFFLQIYESNVTFQKQTEFVRYSLSVTEGRNNCEHQVNMHSDIHSGRQDESVFSRGQLDLYISCVIIFNNCPTKTPEITAVLPPPPTPPAPSLLLVTVTDGPWAWTHTITQLSPPWISTNFALLLILTAVRHQRGGLSPVSWTRQLSLIEFPEDKPNKIFNHTLFKSSCIC